MQGRADGNFYERMSAGRLVGFCQVLARKGQSRVMIETLLPGHVSQYRNLDFQDVDRRFDEVGTLGHAYLGYDGIRHPCP